MNREAVLHYGTPDFTVVRPGEFVRCAVSGRPIALEHLKYWSIARQQAYASAEMMHADRRDARGPGTVDKA